MVMVGTQMQLGLLRGVLFGAYEVFVVDCEPTQEVLQGK